MRNDMRIRELITFLTSYLECSQKTISSLIGINEATLSSNLEKPVEELASKKTGRRLIALVALMNKLSSQGLSNKAAMEIMALPSYKDFKGNVDSIRSSLLTDKYELDMLLVILDLSYKEYVRRNELRNSARLNIDDFLENFSIKTAKTA